jgi:hypothetical protein
MAKAAQAEPLETEPQAPPKARTRLPRPPGRKVEAQQFFDYVATFKEEDWAHAVIYVYRVWPVINRDPKYIDKLSQAVTEQYLLDQHGSGDYKLNLNDVEIEHEVCWAVVKIRDNEKPPKLEDLREVDFWDPINKNYVRSLVREGKMTPQGDVIGPAGAMDGSGASTATLAKALVDLAKDKTTSKGPDDTAISRAFDIIGKAGERSVDLVLSQVKQQDPQSFINLMTAFKDLFPQGGSNEKLFELMMKLQADHQASSAAIQRQNTELLMKLVETKLAGAAGGADGLSVVDKVFGMLEKARGFLGGAGEAGPMGKWEFWGEVIRQGAPALRDMVHDGVHAWQAAMMLRAGQVPQAWTGAPSAPHPAPAVQGALPPPGAPGAPQEKGPAPQAQGVPSTPDARMQVLAQAGPGFINHLTSGKAGDEFAEWVEAGLGPLAYDQLASFGAEGLLTILKQSPFWPQLAPIEARVVEFIAAFLAWGQAGEDAVEEPELAAERPEAVEKPAKRAKRAA